MSKLCDECETVAHCLKHGCIPQQPAYRAVKTYHEGKPVYVAEQPASTLEELYALSREVSAEQPAQPEPRIVQACDHSWNYEGHSHNDSLYVCSKCKKEEWR